jgi:hypothetical protein
LPFLILLSRLGIKKIIIISHRRIEPQAKGEIKLAVNVEFWRIGNLGGGEQYYVILTV